MTLCEMERNVLIIFYLVMVAGNILSVSAANSIEKNPVARYGHLNILIEDLQNLEWGEEEVPCLTLLVKILQNVQNSTLWATWIWDSMQTPVGHLYGSRNNFGNYDECLEFPWEKVHPDLRTQYCMAHIHLAEVESEINDVDFFGNVRNYIQAKTKYHQKFNTLRWGVCTPVVCKPHSVNKFVGALFRQTHLGLAVTKPHISINYCDIAEDTEVTGDIGFYFFSFCVIFAIVLMLLGTLLVNNNGLHATSTGLVLAKAFHIQKNVESLVRITDDDLRPLFGIRVISAVAIIFVHVGMLKHGMGVSNGVRLEKDLEDRWLISMCTLENVVDTFMFMSGLLLIKSLIANGMKPFNPVKVIIKRYFRLIGPVLLVLLIIFKILNVPRGPMKKEFYDTELEACNQNWWTIPLMIQNYVNKDNMCYAVLWSVACDFHLSILGTMGTWLFMRSRKSGLLVFLIAFIASIAVPATGAILNPDVAFMQWDFRVFTKNCKYILENPFYTSTHYRASSYFVGMAVGYLIAMYNPAKYRNVISKKHSILSFGVLLAMFLGFFTLEYKIQTELILQNNVFMLALFVSLRRVVWAVLLAVLVILCEYGTLPLVPGFLGWSALAPICRLSYGIYLIHGAVLSYWTVTTRNNIEHHLYNSVLTVLGVALASCVASLLLWTLFEEPLRIIVSHILRDRNENSQDVKRK